MLDQKLLLLLLTLATVPNLIIGESTRVPMIFKEIGPMVPELSYINAYIPLNFDDVTKEIDWYRKLFNKEFSKERLSTLLDSSSDLETTFNSIVRPLVNLHNEKLDRLKQTVKNIGSQIAEMSSPEPSYPHIQRPDTELKLDFQPKQDETDVNKEYLQTHMPIFFETIVLGKNFDLTGMALDHLSRHLTEKVTYLENFLDNYLQHKQLTITASIRMKLDTLKEQVLTLAAKHNYEIVFDLPRHFHQGKTSLVSVQDRPHLVIHIPITRENSPILLYSFHPFPLPIDKDVSFVPNVGSDILAVSSNTPDLRIWQITNQDLMGCHKEGILFICPQRILPYGRQDNNSSCQAAIFQKKFDLALDICGFDIKQSKEVFYSLPNNWFLTYQPNDVTLNVTCRGDDENPSSLTLEQGVSKFQLETGCEASSETYRLTSSSLPNFFSKNHIQLELEWNHEDFLTESMVGICHALVKAGLRAKPVKLPTMIDIFKSHLEPTINWQTYFQSVLEVVSQIPMAYYTLFPLLIHLGRNLMAG